MGTTAVVPSEDNEDYNPPSWDDGERVLPGLVDVDGAFGTKPMGTLT